MYYRHGQGPNDEVMFGQDGPYIPGGSRYGFYENGWNGSGYYSYGGSGYTVPDSDAQFHGTRESLYYDQGGYYSAGTRSVEGAGSFTSVVDSCRCPTSIIR